VGLTGVFAGGNVTVQVGQVAAEGPTQVLFQSLLAEHQLFAGREQELDRLDGFLDSGGYFFVSAPSGFGKTALLVNWVRALEEKGENLAYAFINRLAGHAGEDVILGALSQQLAAIHGEGGSLPTRTSELRALYVRLLTTAPAAGQRVTVVLDGLDEATGWEARPDLFPPELPEGVAIVFSAREIAETDWLSTLALNDRPVDTLRLTSLGPAEISRILAATGEALPAWASDSQVVDEMYAVSNGDPFYVRYLVADLIPDKEGRIRISSLAELRQQPSGLDGYFENWWAELRQARQSPELGRATRDVLGYLLVAKAPLSRSELSDLGDEDALDDWTVDDALALVRPHTIGDDEAGFSLAHPRFQSYLAEKRLREPEQRVFRDRLLAFCARWREHESPYALRHYAGHLVDAGRSEELFELARDDEFAAVQVVALPFEPALSVRVTELAFDTACELDNAPAIGEFAIRKARKLEAARGGDSPLDALESTGLGSAWALADLHDPEDRVKWHVLIAWGLKDQGRIDEARATLERLLTMQTMQTMRLGSVWLLVFVELRAVDSELAQALEASAFATYERARAAYEKTIALVEAQDFTLAYSTAETIVDDDLRADAYKELSLAQIRAGDLPRARASAERVEDPYLAAWTLTEVALAQEQAGEGEEARATLIAAQAAAEAIEHDDSGTNRPQGLAWVAAAQVQVGDTEAGRRNFAAAQSAAEAINGTWWRVDALAELAVARSRVDGPEAAETSFVAAQSASEAMDGAEWQARRLAKVAFARSQAGDSAAARATFADAQTAAATIDQEWTRGQALSEIAVWQIEAGDLAAAEETAQTIEDDEGRAAAFSAMATALATAQIQAGDLAAAEETAQTIEDDKRRAEALSALATAQMQSGETDAARASFAGAEAAASRIDDKDRAEAYRDLAVAQATGGDFAGGRAVAETIDDDVWRTRALLEVAVTEAKHVAGGAVDNLVGAREAAAAIEDRKERVLALAQIALAQAEANDLEGAIATLLDLGGVAAAIEHEDDRSEALFKLAEAQFTTGDGEAARSSLAAGVTATGTRIDDGWRQRALKEIGLVQAQAGDLPAADATAEAIEDDRCRADVLSALAVAQAKSGDREAARASSTAAQAILKTFEYEEERERALGTLASGLAEAGDFDGAGDIVSSTNTAYQWGWEALVALAVAEAVAGEADLASTDFESAQAEAEGLEDAYWRVWALGRLAAGQIQAGDAEAARANFTGAQETAQAIEDGGERTRALIELASVLTRAGDLDGARASLDAAQAAAETVDNASWRLNFLIEIAVARANADGYEAAWASLTAAEAAVETMADAHFRAHRRIELAEAWAQAGEREAARLTFADVEAVVQSGNLALWSQQSVAEALASAQARAGFGAAAVRTAQGLEGHLGALQLVTDSLAENVDRADLKLVVGLCTAYCELTPAIIALLARAYPEQRLELVARAEPLLA
jgi:hypothetical protein